MVVRNFKTKKNAQEYSKKVTRQSFGSSRPITKQIRKTKKGYTLYIGRRK